MFEQCGEFRAKDKIAVRLVRIEQRFFPNAVACDKERSLALVPDGKCKHPAKQLQAIGAVFVIETNDGLGVRLCVEFMPAFEQALAQFLIVVDLAVEDEPLRFVLIVQRLLPASEVDDRQPTHGEADILADVKTVLVRPAMDDGAVHLLQQAAVGRLPVGVDKPGNSAHQLLLTAIVPLRRLLSTRRFASA